MNKKTSGGADWRDRDPQFKDEKGSYAEPVPSRQLVLDDLAGTHPDLPAKVERIDLCRFGHAMSIPVPGLRGSAALAALNEQRGRVVFAHSDLAGYSVFEEAYTAGVLAARRLSLWATVGG